MNDSQNLPERFNCKAYKYYNKDLLHLTDDELKTHYLMHGKDEKRKYKLPKKLNGLT